MIVPLIVNLDRVMDYAIRITDYKFVLILVNLSIYYILPLYTYYFYFRRLYELQNQPTQSYYTCNISLFPYLFLLSLFLYPIILQISLKRRLLSIYNFHVLHITVKCFNSENICYFHSKINNSISYLYIIMPGFLKYVSLHIYYSHLTLTIIYISTCIRSHSYITVHVGKHVNMVFCVSLHIVWLYFRSIYVYMYILFYSTDKCHGELLKIINYHISAIELCYL